MRSSAGYAPAAVKSQLEDPVTACARSNEAKLRDAYSVADLQHGFGVMISYDPAGIVRSTGADDLPNIKAWLQACLNDALLDKELGRPVRGVEHREIYLFVKAMP